MSNHDPKYPQTDVNLDGSVDGEADAPALVADWDRTWLIPATTNAWFPVKIFNDVALPGVYTLAVGGPSNVVVARYGNVVVRGGESNAVAFQPGSTEETVEVQAAGPGVATLAVSFAGSGSLTNYTCRTEVAITAWSFCLVPDYDRNGVIGGAERQAASTNAIFRLWVNDDNDIGDTVDEGGTDIPGQASAIANCADTAAVANGRRDLLDFFPVMVDISGFEKLAGTVDSLRLKQADGAVNVMYTKLGDMNSDWYLRQDVANCGFGLDSPSRSASVRHVTSANSDVSPWFLSWLRQTGGKGVFLIEGTKASAAPLVLEAVKDGAVVAAFELPLRIAPVEQMYDRVNLRCDPAVVTPGDDLPPSNGKHVVFLHGFNVTAEEAREWHSEMFKRLWQSGADARFHGVTWRGDIGLLNGFHYHENVVSAFETAPHLRDYVNGLSGEKIVMAHSLGNMVVSSAIADYGMGVGKYFMLNAAVASEAYDATLWSDSPDAPNRLVHDDWRSYTNACWSAKWHGFFDPAADTRGKLTWKGRFASVLSSTSVYNFYSSGDSANSEDGDELFELLDETPTVAAGITSSTGRYAWQKQETHKGLSSLDPAGTSWSGWGFRMVEEWPPLPGMGTTYVPYTPEQAAARAQNGTLATDTVFGLEPSSMNASNMTAAVLNEHLAEGIPALSPAAGKTAIFDASHAFNMNTTFKPEEGAWGRDNSHVYKKRWRHSDMKDMAFFYTHLLFDELVEKGDL